VPWVLAAAFPGEGATTANASFRRAFFLPTWATVSVVGATPRMIGFAAVHLQFALPTVHRLAVL
jgi:hypothetical protein